MSQQIEAAQNGNINNAVEMPTYFPLDRVVTKFDLETVQTIAPKGSDYIEKNESKSSKLGLFKKIGVELLILVTLLSLSGCGDKQPTAREIADKENQRGEEEAKDKVAAEALMSNALAEVQAPSVGELEVSADLSDNDTVDSFLNIVERMGSDFQTPAVYNAWSTYLAVYTKTAPIDWTTKFIGPKIDNYTNAILESSYLAKNDNFIKIAAEERIASELTTKDIDYVYDIIRTSDVSSTKNTDGSKTYACSIKTSNNGKIYIGNLNITTKEEVSKFSGETVEKITNYKGSYQEK